MVGGLRGENQFVGDHNDGVAVGSREPPKGIQQSDLRCNVKMKSGFIEQKEQRLLRQSTGENDALLFTAGNLIHPAVTQISGADLGKSVLRDQDVVLRCKAQRAPVGMAALQDKFPGTRGEEQRALLLDPSDALSASVRRQRLCKPSVKQNAPGQRRQSTRDQ